jgi:isoprenylcysteine carboxyl methyltransferase (ICMT) family protein YpbQ
MVSKFQHKNLWQTWQNPNPKPLHKTSHLICYLSAMIQQWSKHLSFITMGQNANTFLIASICEQNFKPQERVQALTKATWTKHHNYFVAHGQAQNA